RDSYPRLFIRSCNMWDSPEHYSPMVRRICFREPWVSNHQVDRVLRKAVNTLVSPLRRRYPEGLTPYFGSAYWSITSECARAALDWHDAKPWFARYYSRVSSPDEQYFHTI